MSSTKEEKKADTFQSLSIQKYDLLKYCPCLLCCITLLFKKVESPKLTCACFWRVIKFFSCEWKRSIYLGWFKVSKKKYYCKRSSFKTQLISPWKKQIFRDEAQSTTHMQLLKSRKCWFWIQYFQNTFSNNVRQIARLL